MTCATEWANALEEVDLDRTPKTAEEKALVSIVLAYRCGRRGGSLYELSQILGTLYGSPETLLSGPPRGFLADEALRGDEVALPDPSTALAISEEYRLVGVLFGHPVYISKDRKRGEPVFLGAVPALTSDPSRD